MIPYGRQEITGADIDAVTRVLKADYLTQGPEVPLFEEEVARRVGARHAVAVNSATSALHIACLSVGLGPGDILWTVPTTFVASANCGLYCGAEVDFVDIDACTWNISIPRLKEKLVAAGRDGRLPKVLVPVHLTGQPTEQEQIADLAREFGFRVLEDASHSVGASRNGEAVGNCRWSDITIFSFHPVKIITSGEGGMALTNDAALAARMALLRSHGITRDSSRFVGEVPAGDCDHPAWYYEQQELGFNYRLTDIQAALGRSQLTRIDSYVERRNVLARRYDEALSSLSLQLPSLMPGNRSAYHLYVVRLVEGHRATSHREVFEALRGRGIGVNLHYMPVHLQPYYRALGFGPGQYPESEAYARSAMTLPLYPSLTEAQQDEVVRALEAIL